MDFIKRQDLIDKLFDNDFNDIQQELSNGEKFFLENILLGGWKGYQQMTDEELETEIANREL